MPIELTKLVRKQLPPARQDMVARVAQTSDDLLRQIEDIISDDERLSNTEVREAESGKLYRTYGFFVPGYFLSEHTHHEDGLQGIAKLLGQAGWHSVKLTWNRAGVSVWLVWMDPIMRAAILDAMLRSEKNYGQSRAE